MCADEERTRYARAAAGEAINVKPISRSLRESDTRSAKLAPAEAGMTASLLRTSSHTAGCQRCAISVKGMPVMQSTTSTGQAQQMPMATPLDLFVHELSDMFSAEQIVTEMLGVAAEAASNGQLKQGLLHHQQESQQQAENLQRVFQTLGQNPHPVRCHAAEGLMESLREGLQSSQSNVVTDGLIAAGSIKTENLEIASYMGLVEKARLMGETNAAALLQQN